MPKNAHNEHRKYLTFNDLVWGKGKRLSALMRAVKLSSASQSAPAHAGSRGACLRGESSANCWALSCLHQRKGREAPPSWSLVIGRLTALE